jgi:type IV secretory pathway VirB10-like protein
MANPNSEDAEEKPLDPAVARVQARLQRLMLIAGSTLGLGILAVFLAIIYRITASDDKTPIAPGAEVPVVTAPEAAPAPMSPPPAAPVVALPPLPPEAPAQAETGSVAEGTEAAMLAAEATVPADARLVASTVAGGRIVLTYDHFAGTMVILVDPSTLRIVGRLDLKPE